MVIHDNVSLHQNGQYEFYCEGRECTLGHTRHAMCHIMDRYLIWPRVIEVKEDIGTYESNITILCEECAIKAGILW